VFGKVCSLMVVAEIPFETVFISGTNQLACRESSELGLDLLDLSLQTQLFLLDAFV